jgi:hypothetical protein
MGSTVFWDGPRPQPHRGGGQLSRKTIIFSISFCVVLKVVCLKERVCMEQSPS